MKALDAERVARQHELERENALSEQRRALLRATAHELATPLTPVLLDSAMLGRQDLPPQARGQWERLHRNLGRLQEAIARAIAAARQDGDLEAGAVLGPDGKRMDR
jgi:signal transduction histidine kinase